MHGSIQALRAALECRVKYGIALDTPCDIYELISQNGLSLRFMEVTSLEGLYLVDGKAGEINVCAHRPSGLQKFIAAHEFGHHVFGHGAKIDRELDYKERFSSFPEDEKLAEMFARFLLMPLRAVHKGFKNIGAVLDNLQPTDVFRVSCWLGVGYSTLLHQMRFSLHILQSGDFERLMKTKPQQIKASLEPSQGRFGRDELWPMDSSWNGHRVHARVGDVLSGIADKSVSIIVPIRPFSYRANTVGETRCDLKGGGSITLSISRNPYIGLYRYRYLPEVADLASPSISEVWKQAVALAIASVNREVYALVATVTDLSAGGPQEDIAVRTCLDRSLLENGNASVETVASTIFPQALWNSSSPRQALFDRYRRIFPKVKQHPKNRRGTYFQRMIAYPELENKTFNQLDQVISTYIAGNHRRSALQASVIVPRLDLNNARRLGFPCMHQVAFLPDGARQTLRVVGYYPMQYLYERAYGNYLGLIRLGYFMAQEMNLELEAMSCVSVVAKLEVSEKVVQTLLQ